MDVPFFIRSCIICAQCDSRYSAATSLVFTIAVTPTRHEKLHVLFHAFLESVYHHGFQPPTRPQFTAYPHRREAVLEIIRLLNTIQESEAEYRDSIPEQFEHRQEAAEHACDQLAEALSSLEEAY